MKGRRSTRKVAAPPPEVDALINRILASNNYDLVAILKPVDVWLFPRGDMNSWINVIQKFRRILRELCDSYGIGQASSKVCKLQLNEFTPRDKELILQVLGFSRLLLENCTARKLFDAYDVIADLLLTSDLDVLQATLYVLLRPLQQYLTALPTGPELGATIKQRLLSLSLGWDRFEHMGYDLVRLATDEGPLTLSGDAAHVQVQFYPRSDLTSNKEPEVSSSSSPSQPLTTLANPLETPTRPRAAAGAGAPTIATTSSVSKSTPHAALSPLVAQKSQATVDGNSMVTVDLGNVLESMSGDYLDHLAAAAEEYSMGPDEQLTALNKVRLVVLSSELSNRRKLLSCRLLALSCYLVFSSEETAMSHIFLYEPELVTQIAELLAPGNDVGDQVTASALVALYSAAHHRNDVVSAVNANVSHGILMSLMRNVVTKLVNGQPVSHDVVDALLGIVSFINTLQLNGSILVGAGVIPLLLEMLGTVDTRRRGQYISRAAMLLDQVVFSQPQALQAFTNADGINILVARIKGEVKMLTSESGPVIKPEAPFTKDCIITYEAGPLKSELRSIYRLLQSSGGADGFRNVVDTDLPKSLKLVFTHSNLLGVRNFTLAINVMSTIIHNEPTCLSILQEQKLPQTLYEQLEINKPQAFEVVQVLPNAIGAICLNQAGLQSTIEHMDVISNIIKVAISWPIEDTDPDQVLSVGRALDELVRHHPALRPKVLDAVLSITRQAIEEGKVFKPVSTQASEYAADSTDVVDTAMDVSEEAGAPKDANMNPPLAKITNILRLFEGLLRNSSMCRDFTKEGGVDLILSIPDLPCIPVYSTPPEVAIAIPGVLRIIGEHDSIALTERMVKAVQADLDAHPELWKDKDALALWSSMAREDSTTEDHHRLRTVAALAMRISFLSEYLMLNFGSHRSGTALIKSLGVKSGSQFVSNLGLLHRVCFLEHVLLKDTPPAPAAPLISESRPISSPTTGDDTVASEATQATAPDVTTGQAGTANEQPGETPGNTVAVTEAPPVAKAPNPPTRAQAVKTMVTRLHAILIKFFKAAIRLIFNKRVPESTHRAEADALAECISGIIIGHLKASGDLPHEALAVDTLTLGLATMLLFDDRGTEGFLATYLYIPFEKTGGFATLLDNVQRIVHAMDRQPIMPDDKGTAEQTKEHKLALNGIRIAISVLSGFASPRALMDSPQTVTLSSREHSMLPKDKRFWAANHFVQNRRDILPIAHHIWTAEWLPTLPLQQGLRAAVTTFLEIMAAENEELQVTIDMADPMLQQPVVRQAQPRPQITADPTHVAQLVDMGFGRHAAERALLRARNNLNAAADLLLSQPHLFPNEDPEPASTANANTETSASAGENAVDGEGGEQRNADDSDVPASTGAVGDDAEQAQAGPSSETQGTASQSPDVAQEGEDTEMDVDSGSPSIAWEQQHDELDKVRNEYKPGVALRAIQLLDTVEDLVFDLLPAFPSGVEGVSFIFSKLDEAIKESPRRDTVVSARLRLISAFARPAPQIELQEDEAKAAMSTLTSLSVDTTPRPSWLASYILAAESILLMSYGFSETKLGDTPATSIVRSVDFGEIPAKLFRTAVDALSESSLSREEIMSCLRLIVVLTRRDDKLCTPDLLRHILANFKTANVKLAGCQPFLSMVVRHAFESTSMLRDLMRDEIREWMSPQLNKVTDVNHFVRQLKQMAYRDADVYLAAVEDECALVDPTPVQSVYHIRAQKALTAPKELSQGESKEGVDWATQLSAPGGSDPFQGSTADSFETHPVMDFILGEIGSTLRSIQKEETGKRSGTDYSETIGDLYAYAGLLLSLVTELVGSYLHAKKALMAGFRQGALSGTGKGRAGISNVLSDLAGSVTLADVQDRLRGVNDVAAARRITLAGWVKALIVALCANTTITSDIKDLPEDLVTVRKTVLESLARSLKDSSHAHGDIGVRYGRLWALGEIVYSLLTTRPGITPRMQDDSTLHIAKTMLEKNFVALLTTAMSELDLNFPNIRNVLVSLLKAVEFLTKASIKWGKSDKKKEGEEDHADESDHHHMSESSEGSDMDMSEDEDDDTPDLYRNSALGILGGELDVDDEDDEEGDMDEDDDMMEAFDDGMDDVMDDDDQDTEPSSDEDDDDDDEDDMEGDWSTEEEDEGEEEHVFEDHVELADMDDDAVPWDEDGMMPGEEVVDFGSEGEEDDGFMDGGEFASGLDMDEEEEALEDFADEGGFDEIDPMDALTGTHPMAHEHETMGHWGWQEYPVRSDNSRRSRPMDIDGATSSLFAASHRQSADTTQHPLLVGGRAAVSSTRPSHSPFSHMTGMPELFAAIQGLGRPQAVNQFMESIVNFGRGNGPMPETILVDLTQNADGGFGLSIGGRPFPVSLPAQRHIPTTANDLQAEYRPRPTLQRWSEEQNIFPYNSPEQLARLVIHIINRLLPAARKAADEEAERLRKIEEEEAAEAAKKREEATTFAASFTLPESRPETALQTLIDDEDVEMGSEDDDDDDDDEDDDDEDEDAEDPPGERVTITIHGEEVDITDTGIDLEFLQALPDDMRADVVEQHLREQNRLTRPQAGDAPASSSQISAEFLDALPPEIRAEVIMQERIDSARRSQSQQAARAMEAAAASNPPALFDLEPDLRDVMSGTDILNVLARGAGFIAPAHGGTGPSSQPPRPKRDAIQLLDKPGIASLVRLLFFPEALRKDYLQRTMVNLCENSKTRTDLLNLLLSIVQDGSGDLPAVDRSFQMMSLRGLQTPKASTSTPKGKSIETPAPLTAGLLTHLQTEHIPTFITQRCFEALSYIVSSNSQAVTYFLTEHEQPVGLKKQPSKKGRGKEKYLPQTKFPIVILIGLLDRPALLKTPGMMESFASLLAAITKPLATLKPGAEATQSATADATEQMMRMTRPDTANALGASVAAAPAQASASAVPQDAPASGSGSAVATGGPSDTASAAAKAPALTAPVIPPTVLRLVINLLTTGDVTSRTFSSTLAVLQNLSYIPDAKQVLVQELCTRSQQLGSTIDGELAGLAEVLQDEHHEIDNSVLTAFSPAGSSQAQLLRLLKTIDYLHSRKVEVKAEDEKAARDIFRSFDFTSMWEQLGRCLTLAEERDNTDQISGILLPLVEALMVVCKHTRPEDAATIEQALSPTLQAQAPLPSDLFMSFTTTHRKVLNAIVRNNPALLSGSFSLLVANPRVLEFDNKRNWFIQKLKRKRDQLAYPSLHLNVRRQYVFQDSYSALLHRPGDEIRYGKINVKFINEDGVDAGGVTREWYSVLAQQIFDPNFALFEPCAADQQTYQINKHSFVNEDHLSFFKFVGRVIGKAIYDGRLLDAYFSRAFYKQILGRPVEMRDLESVDPEFHKSLQWMLDNDITDIIDQEFTIEDDSFGETRIVELKEGGAKIPVTEENKQEYVNLVCAYRLENATKDQKNSFLTGFYEMIPRELIKIFEADQLELLISGLSTIDVDELKNAVQLSGLKNSDPEVGWLFRALRSFSQEERARFLMFVTSSSRVPLGGFSQLQGASGIQPMQISRLHGKGALPQASTCFNALYLPEYDSYEQLRSKLLFAISETSGFGKA